MRDGLDALRSTIENSCLTMWPSNKALTCEPWVFTSACTFTLSVTGLTPLPRTICFRADTPARISSVPERYASPRPTLHVTTERLKPSNNELAVLQPPVGMCRYVMMAHTKWQCAAPSVQPFTCMLLLTVRRKSAGNAAAARGLGFGTPNILRTLAQYSSCPLTVLSTPTTCISITLQNEHSNMLLGKCRRLSQGNCMP